MGMAKKTADMVVEAYFKNNGACQVEKIGDVWKNWCLEDMDRCLGLDGQKINRLFEHGMDVVGIIYHLGVMFWKHDGCKTDAERITEIAETVEDLSNLSTYIHGFSDKWTTKDIEHIPQGEFHKDVKDYK